MKSKWTALILCILFSTVLLAGCGDGEKKAEKYPSKPITMYVNYGAGGSTDLSARSLAKAAEKHLGVPVVVVNKPGANGVTGITELKNGTKDGQTIGVMTFAPVAIVPNQTKVPYTPEDFEGIIAYGEYNYCIAVKADSPYKSITDLVSAAKAKPEGFSYSASGYPQPFAANRIGEKDGVKFRYVNFKSGTEVMTALIGGHVDFTVVTTGDLLPFLKSGEVRILAACGDKRMSQAPNAPTMKELGYDMSMVSWMGVGSPIGVPQDKLNVLREAFKKAAADPEFLKTMKTVNLEAIAMPGPDFKKKLVDGHKEIGAYFKQIGQNK
ncbi:MAG: tripartite tricarboxylate transporter substrate binding protein [Negativicutes bacterium]